MSYYIHFKLLYGMCRYADLTHSARNWQPLKYIPVGSCKTSLRPQFGRLHDKFLPPLSFSQLSNIFYWFLYGLLKIGGSRSKEEEGSFYFMVADLSKYSKGWLIFNSNLAVWSVLLLKTKLVCIVTGTAPFGGVGNPPSSGHPLWMVTARGHVGQLAQGTITSSRSNVLEFSER